MSSQDPPIPLAPLRWACLLVWAMGALIWISPLNETFSRPWIDQQLRWLAAPAPLVGVTVIDIDEDAVNALQAQLGPWPYRRDVYALAIDELRRIGVRAIALDLVLSESREGDAALGREILRPGAPVVLAATAQGPASFPDKAAAGADVRWSQIKLPASSILPAQDLSARLGVVTMPVDSDGRLRRWPLWHETADQRWPALPLAIWRATHRADALAWPPADLVGMTTIPIGEPAGAAPRLAFSAVIDAALERTPRQALANRLRDHVIILGAGSLQTDQVLGPGGLLSATEALAQAYSALRERRLARLPRAPLDLAMAIVAGLPLLLVGISRRPSIRQGLMGLLLVGLALATAMAAALWAWGQLTQPVAAIAVLLASAFALAAWRQRELEVTQSRTNERRLQAEAASRAKTEFLAHVSHEIRTPMNALLGAAELLSRSPLGPKEQKLVGLFNEAGHRLLVMLNDMLDLSRIEAGRLDLQASPFSLRDSLMRVCALVQARAERKGLALNLHIEQNLPEGVLGDSQRLEQILLNLLSNAISYTERGGVTLDVQTSRGMIRFEVADTGVGIDADQLGSIFEPFKQAHNDLPRDSAASGLGLAIVRQLTQAMGGQIEVFSEPGRGSRFSLLLPLPEADLPAPQVPSQVGSGAGPAAAALETRPDQDRLAATPTGSRQVLLVEDNDVNIIIFQAMLHSLGVQVDVANDGAQGLEHLRAKPYDLVFVDLQMPVMDGLTMVRLWRQEEAARSNQYRTPLVALTANAYPTDVRLCLEAGFDSHLTKPCSQEQLLDALARFARTPPAATDGANTLR